MTQTDNSAGPSGIGGWLLLPLLGLIIGIAATGYNLLQIFLTWDGVSQILFGSDSNLAYLRIPVFASLASGVIVFLLAWLCMFLMLTRSPRTPKWMIGYYLFGLVVAGIEYYAINVMQTATADVTTSLIGGVVGAAIWIPYFRYSKRVANTFRRPDANEAERVFS